MSNQLLGGMVKMVAGEATGEKNPEAHSFAPALPELPRQLFTSMGYVEECFEPRIKLEASFSIPDCHGFY